MTGRSSLTMWLLVLSVSASAVVRAESPTSDQIAFFESKVRPILVEHCYECHSTEAGENEAGLSLDSRSGWQTGGDSGAAIVPGDVKASLLIHAVRYDEEIVSGMPPRSKLPDPLIEILEQWVKIGAPDPRTTAPGKEDHAGKKFDLQDRREQHWSWQPVARHQPPDVLDDSWPRSEIDRFILAKLEAAGLRPADPADKRSLLRRVYFDLIGLPPSRQQIAEFLADHSDHAYERIVDQLFESSHFGEKWARHWMDLVRYAETYGHEFDYPIRHAHEYRDYLIRALDADVPYDQLVREHIAGDLLSEPRRHPSEGWNESIIGTGFWYLHEATHAPTDVLGNEADIIDNQIDVFGKAFLGLTVACARCHDHKFDAISTADYYALSAFLQSSCRQETPLDTGRRIERATDEIRRLRGHAATQLQTISPQVAERLQPGKYFEAASELHRRREEDGQTEEVSSDLLARFAESKQLDEDRLRLWIQHPKDLSSISSEDFPDSSTLFADFSDGHLPAGWSRSGFAFEPVGTATTLSVDGQLAAAGSVDSGLAGKRQVGTLRSPTFEITTEQIHVRMKATAGITMRVVMDNYQMTTFHQLLFRGTIHSGKATDTEGKWIWKRFAGDLKKYIGHKAYLEFIDNSDATIAIDQIRFGDPPRAQAKPVRLDSKRMEESWHQGLADLRDGKSNRFIGRMLDCGFVSIQDLSQEASRTLSQAKSIADRLPTPRFAVAMAQGTPEPARVYIRGSHLNPGDQVPARFLDALGGQQVSRLGLAELIAAPDNPLTGRVIVNRLWQHALGRGIVRTVDDFGPQGEPPSHPELLDWLTQDFIANGWSLKHTLRKIVLSQTYRQACVPHPELDPEFLSATDPTNALLHRMRVRRLPAESLRDAILFVSGRLDTKPFGPSVATHRTEFMTGRGARASGPLDGDGRRSIYLAVYRNFLNPFLLAFDMPSPFGPTGRRGHSNVPAQALTLMNDPFVAEQAEIWAKRILAQRELTDRQRIERMMEASLGTRPTATQMLALEAFLGQQAAAYGEADQRAWTDLAQVLLNTKAFCYLR